MEGQTGNISQKYIALAERFKSVPNTRKNSVRRAKMIIDFVCWYRKNKGILTEKEKEYLQNNIYKVHESDYNVSHA